ncbi:hypothetical protein [Allostreptomyces psammosilenae]|uniref:SAM-dependent methyltransferase n=1 Tax=Allostreptomyces psammosilenae TaxID=1892865 RepID=A0A852ZWN3_9ACTN|nr:hypothetical protein [Allostreptomyces psammosilenae]NYI06619.1 SAM-dependent methyltransferase [Allostreptomyces psammosilenae]
MPTAHRSDRTGSADSSGTTRLGAALASAHRYTGGPTPAYLPARPSPAEQRLRDWSEIQERMLVPVYEEVWRRLGLDAHSRLLLPDCGSGLALLLARSRGAHVTGVDTDPGLLRLAAERLERAWAAGHGGRRAEARPHARTTAATRPPHAPAGGGGSGGGSVGGSVGGTGPAAGGGGGGVGSSCPASAGGTPSAAPSSGAGAVPGHGRPVKPRPAVPELPFPAARPFAFRVAGAERLPYPAGAFTAAAWFSGAPGAADASGALAELRRVVAPGGLVAAASWGPADECEVRALLELAERLSGPLPSPAQAQARLREAFALGRPGALEDVAERALLRPAGVGQVDCPFHYADLDSAVAGLLATGWFDTAVESVGQVQVTKEVGELLHTRVRPDGTVRLANTFRYVLAYA